MYTLSGLHLSSELLMRNRHFHEFTCCRETDSIYFFFSIYIFHFFLLFCAPEWGLIKAYPRSAKELIKCLGIWEYQVRAPFVSVYPKKLMSINLIFSFMSLFPFILVVYTMMWSHGSQVPSYLEYRSSWISSGSTQGPCWASTAVANTCSRWYLWWSEALPKFVQFFLFVT